MTTKEAKNCGKQALKVAIREALENSDTTLAKRLYGIFEDRFQSTIRAMERLLNDEQLERAEAEVEKADKKAAAKKRNHKVKIRTAIDAGDKKGAGRLLKSFVKKYEKNIPKFAKEIEAMPDGRPGHGTLNIDGMKKPRKVKKEKTEVVQIPAKVFEALDRLKEASAEIGKQIDSLTNQKETYESLIQTIQEKFGIN